MGLQPTACQLVLMLPEDRFVNCVYTVTVLVGPCHQGMVHPQVADRGTASDMEGSCE